MEVLTEDHCKKILQKENPASQFKSFEIKPLVQESSGGLIGLHYNLEIQYVLEAETKTLNLFVKTLNNKNNVMFKISKELLFFEKERLFFMDLLPEYERIGIDVSFAPYGYLCEDNALVLADLTESEFKLYPKEKPMDIKHCYACLNNLAQFHASSLLFEICKSKSLGRKFSVLEENSEILADLIFAGGDTYGTKYVKESVNGLLALAELEFEDISSLQQLKNIYNSNESPPFDNLCCVILHGDLWNNNFLHKYDDDGKIVETRLIDFQTIKYGPPSVDVLQLIYTNTTKAFRNDHFDDLISFYYQKFEEIFNDRGLHLRDYLPKFEFLETCVAFKVPVKLQAVIDRCLTGIPDKIYRDVTSSDELFYDFIFVNRSKYLVESYSRIPIYRDMVSEDLRELKDMLSELE